MNKNNDRQVEIFAYKSRYMLLDFILIFISSSFLLGVLIGILTSLGIEIDISNPENPIFVSLFYCAIMISICITTILRIQKSDLDPMLLVGTIWSKQIPWLMILTVSYAEKGVSRGIRLLCLYVSHLTSPNDVELLLKQSSFPFSYDASLLLTFFAIVIVAPLTEEFIFRGVLLHRWSSKWGVAIGITTSSVVFGLLHGDLFVAERISGAVIYALLYFKTQSLMVPIVLHTINNLLAFVGTILSDLTQQDSGYEIDVTYLWYAFVQFSLALPALLYFLKIPSKRSELPYVRNQQSLVKK